MILNFIFQSRKTTFKSRQNRIDMSSFSDHSNNSIQATVKNAILSKHDGQFIYKLFNLKHISVKLPKLTSITILLELWQPFKKSINFLPNFNPSALT